MVCLHLRDAFVAAHFSSSMSMRLIMVEAPSPVALTASASELPQSCSPHCYPLSGVASFFELTGHGVMGVARPRGIEAPIELVTDIKKMQP